MSQVLINPCITWHFWLKGYYQIEPPYTTPQANELQGYQS